MMKIPYKEVTDLEDNVVNEINYCHNTFPGGCDLKADTASSNIIDMFVMFLEKNGIEVTI